jgi:hydroxyacylglutathione hydrolase
MQPLTLLALPAFSDNYVWLLHDGREAVVVDPGDAAPVLTELDARALRLVGILVTHHHADHVGGIDALRPRLQGPVWGPRREAIPEPYLPLDDGDRVQALGLSFSVLDVPGHTAGHVAYYCGEAPGAPLLFCGDTLFSGGCGRLFEGSPQQMWTSLQRLAALPASTRVCCAHEYTLSNLRFAQAVEPDNAAQHQYLLACQQRRADQQPTLPSTVGLERQINPFLRCQESAVQRSARQHGAEDDAPVSVFTALREWKNSFR